MAVPQRLQAGSISPSARPVNTFLSFDSNSRPAAPARPQLMSQTPRVTTIQRGNQRSVQGVNSLQELTDALKPLSKLYDAGVEMYASDQYQRGQNEILRAAANVNRDTIIKGYSYAEDNRQLSAENPIAGVLMDQSNPFRRAGQINQASRWAASLVPDLMRAQWLKYGSELAKVDPTSPAVTAVQAQVTNDIAQSFGLDEFSPGFQQYVIPQINKSYEWLANKQLEANVKYQKDAGVRQTSQVLNSIVQDKLFRGGDIRDRWTEELNEAAARFGITGEPQAMTRKAILQALEYWTSIAYNPGVEPAQRQLAASAISLINNLPSGVVDKDGNSIPVGIAYASEGFSAQAEVARDLRAISDAQKELQIQDATDFIADPNNATPTQLMSGPQLDDLVKRLKQKFPELNTFEIYEIIQKGTEATEEFTQSLFDPAPLDDFFNQADGLVGSDWDEAAQRREFDRLTINATGENKRDADKRWNELKSRKAAEQKANIDRTVINRNIDSAAKAAVMKLYPAKGVGWIKEAASRGQTVVEYLGTKDGDAAAAVQRITSDLQRTIINRIQKETAKNKGALSFTEQGDIAQEEINRLMKDEARLRQLAEIPEPEVEENEGQGQGEQSSGTQEVPVVYLPGSTIPESAAKGNKPVYSKADTADLSSLLFRNKPIPAGVKRAARAAGMTPGEFVLKQVDLHGIELQDSVRKKILSNSNRTMGAEDSLFAAKPAATPVARSSGVLLDILLGTAPSYSRPV